MGAAPVADHANLGGQVVRVAEALVRGHAHKRGRAAAAARGHRMKERSLERGDDHHASEQGSSEQGGTHSLPNTFRWGGSAGEVK